MKKDYFKLKSKQLSGNHINQESKCSLMLKALHYLPITFTICLSTDFPSSSCCSAMELFGLEKIIGRDRTLTPIEDGMGRALDCN